MVYSVKNVVAFERKTSFSYFLVPAAILLLIFMASASSLSAKDPDWTGRGKIRLLVKADPLNIGKRTSDEMPASYSVNFVELLAANKIAGEVDLSSLQVHKYNPQTGAAEKFEPFDSAISPYDHPCRFDDNAVPEDYPSNIGHSSDYKDGRPPLSIAKRKGRLFDREMENTAGQIIWAHNQQDNQPSYYAIYFDVQPSKKETGPSPAPWIGDADVLRKKEGQPPGGVAHFTVTAGDFNGDGLFDLVASAEKGDVMWYPNHGTLGHPKFVGCRMMTDEKGPIDVGWYGAPFLYDWNNDGLTDLLIGTSHNVILWWKNIGTPTSPKLKYMEFIQADGKRLEVPQSPVAEDTKAIFAKDYYNQPWVGDWDGDGLPDILTGGYTTGMIFRYRSTGRDSEGVPILKYIGPIEADGQPIDVTWAASPTAYDFNGDGKLELLTGSWWWSGIPYPPKPGQVDFLMYYENTGTRALPNLTRRAMPKTGDFPPGGEIARATVVDWNNDGLPDLLVNSHGSDIVSLFLNEGTPKKPMWPSNGKPLTIPWGLYTAAGLGNDIVDMDADGQGDVSINNGNSFYSITGSAYSPSRVNRGTATIGGKPIEHPGPGYGDGHRFTIMRDWDKDGRADLLWGTHQGNIYLHRNLGGSDPFEFAEGVKLKLNSGEDLKVGPPVVDSPEKAVDFTILQGSRINFMSDDFDGDGIDDLAVTETYGNVWIFLNTKIGGINTLAPGVKVAKFAQYVWGGFNPIEWNGDGKTDIISEGNTAEPGQLLLNISKPGKPAFSGPLRPQELQNLPHVFWGADFRGADWNKDGDDDLLIQSESYSFWAERSFLTHGYSKATLAGGLQKKGQ